jgi:hypothetical protein
MLHEMCALSIFSPVSYLLKFVSHTDIIMPREATSEPGGSPTRKKAKSKAKSKAKTKKTPTVQSNLMFRVDRNKYKF